jgi:Zn-dependent protease
MDTTFIISIIIIILSLVIHELGHAYAATALGDDIPRLQGRLSINPFVHLEWFGSFIFPGILMLTGSPLVFGWAKPVMFNERNFTGSIGRKYGRVITAIAGPLMNIILAIVFGVITRLLIGQHIMTSELLMLMGMVVTINLSLALFNLIPLPPLDGHYIWDMIMPRSLQLGRITSGGGIVVFIGMILIASLIWSKIFEPVIPALTKMFMGV